MPLAKLTFTNLQTDTLFYGKQNLSVTELIKLFELMLQEFTSFYFVSACFFSFAKDGRCT